MPQPSLSFSPRGWLLALAFWPCLLFAAALYAAVALSPKALAHLTLSQQYHTQQLRLVAVEQQVQQITKVIEAHRDDPAFAREQARVAFNTAPPDEQRIPVASDLALPPQSAAADLSVAAPDLPWYTPLLRLIAEHRQIGDLLLSVAAALILYAFAFLHDRGAPSAAD